MLQELSQILLPDLKRLQTLIVPSQTDRGDAISALVVAIEMIAAKCKKLKYRKSIVLITDGTGAMDFAEIQPIVERISEFEIKVIVLGVDFDDEDFGFKEENKSKTKRQNERDLAMFVEQCNGVYGTMAQAIQELGEPRLKETRPVASFKDRLTLGDIEKYDIGIVIEVERYPRTMVRRPPTASSFVQNLNASHGQTATQDADTVMQDADGEEDGPKPSTDGLATVRNTITYLIDDPEAPGRKLDVQREDLARGYEYGRTAVHISESDEGITKLETKAVLEVVGFVPRANVGVLTKTCVLDH